MKKLMIAAAIVCAAAMSQASSFKWTTSELAYGPAASVLKGDLKNGQVLANGTSKTTDIMQKETFVTWTAEIFLADHDNPDFNNTVPVTEIAYSSGKITTAGLTDSKDVIRNGTATKPAVIDYSIVITGKFTGKDGNEWTITSDAITGQGSYGDLSTLAVNSSGPAKWTATTEAIPEPTSGLLLLLGVAGLALRRKQK